MTTAKQNLSLWLIFSCMTYLLIGISTPYLSSWGGNIGMDNAVYHIIGREWFNGSLPYVNFSDLKGPLQYLYFGLASLITPDSFASIAVIHSMLIGVGFLFSYKTARLFVGKHMALATICVYFYWSRWFLGNPSEIVWICQHVAIYHVMLYATGKLDKITASMLLCWGIFVGIGITTKFTLIAFFGPICMLGVIKGEYSLWRNFLLQIAGCLMIILPFSIYFIATGALKDLWYEYIIMAIQYGSCPIKESALVTQNIKLFNALTALPANLPIHSAIRGVLGAALAFSGFLIFRNRLIIKRNIFYIFAISFTLTFIACFIGRFYFDQYYISLNPFIYVTTLYIAQIISTLNNDNLAKIVTFGGVLTYVATLIMANIFSYKKCKTENSPAYIFKQELHQIVADTKNADVLVTGGLTGLVSYYVIGNKSPQMKYFIPPLTSNGKTLYESNIAKCLINNTPDYVLANQQEQQTVEKLITNAGLTFTKKEGNLRSAQPIILYKIEQRPQSLIF